jgi:hypothetical protein
MSRGCTLSDVTFTPEQRRQRARQGAYAQQAAHDTRKTTRNARLAFNQRFLDQVDPDGTLPEAERARRALAARRAYFAGLALRSSMARRKRAAETTSEPLGDDEY